MTILRALIVDDEPLARRRLKALLGDEEGIEIVGEAGDGGAAVAAIGSLQPDVVFLDVQMPGMDGFDVLDALSPSTCPTVVFVTAYDQYALQAFNVHAADYLLKPFDRKRLHHALVRVRALAGGDAEAAAARLLNLVAAVRTSRYLERIVIKSANRVYFVRAADVDRIEAAGHYLTLHVGREEHVMRGTIREIAARLHPDRFVRVHRSTIVNLDRVKELIPTFHGEYEIVLRDGTRVTSSRGYSDRLQVIVRGTPG
jgi:two-component system, LytTR family, response regulator